MVPVTMTIALDDNLLLASAGKLSICHERMLYNVALNLIADKTLFLLIY